MEAERNTKEKVSSYAEEAETPISAIWRASECINTLKQMPCIDQSGTDDVIVEMECWLAAALSLLGDNTAEEEKKRFAQYLEKRKNEHEHKKQRISHFMNNGMSEADAENEYIKEWFENYMKEKEVAD